MFLFEAYDDSMDIAFCPKNSDEYRLQELKEELEELMVCRNLPLEDIRRKQGIILKKIALYERAAGIELFIFERIQELDSYEKFINKYLNGSNI